MSHYMNYKEYVGTVEYSSEDDCLYGKVLGIHGLMAYEGQSVAELKEDFYRTVDEYISLCEEKGIMRVTEGSGSIMRKP